MKRHRYNGPNPVVMFFFYVSWGLSICGCVTLAMIGAAKFVSGEIVEGLLQIQTFTVVGYILSKFPPDLP